jgi:regulator of sigma E protease
MQAINLLTRFFTYEVVVFLLVLGVLIFVHEFGHFLFARLFGVRVLVFKLGFGRFLWSIKRGYTEYGVALFPIGGYVKMFGDPSEMEDLEPEEVSESDRRQALFAQPAWKRLFIFAGGPAMNVLLAFIIAPVIYLVGIEKPKFELEPPVVRAILPDSPAARSGLQVGDRILSAGAKATPTAYDLRWQEMVNPHQTLSYRIEREGRQIEVPITLEEEKPEAVGYSGIVVYLASAVVVEVLPDLPAAKAGFEKGDRIVAINQVPIEYLSQLPRLIQASQGRESVFRIRRAGRELELRAAPINDAQEKKYILGIKFEADRMDTVVIRTSLGEAIKRGSADAIDAGAITVIGLYKILSLQLSPRGMGGPVMIAGLIGEAAQSGFSYLIWIVVMISVNLGILNILPVPPLDGGHILFTVIEAVIRREVNLKYKEAIFRVSMAFFLALFVLITVNDLMRYRQGITGFFRELAKGLGLL